MCTPYPRLYPLYEIIQKAFAMFNSVRESLVFTDGFQWLTTPGIWQLLLCFLASSFFMISRLNAIEKNGFEGTLIGTLVMPYFSGFPNLCFAWLLIQSQGSGRLVLENCLVNNITNLTLVLSIPAVLWGINLYKGAGKAPSDTRINHLSLLLSILALIFFSLAVFFVSKDGLITASDGMLLTGIFLFWQLFHLFDMLKNNTRNNRRIKKRILIDLVIICFCAWGIFTSIEGLIGWINTHGNGFFASSNLGFLSGILMVIPNAVLAIYYAAANRSEIAYSSQIGDCHICIPLCIGLFAIFSPITVSAAFFTPLFILIGASAGHFVFTIVTGRLPRFAGIALAGLYAFFIYKEII